MIFQSLIRPDNSWRAGSRGPICTRCSWPQPGPAYTTNRMTESLVRYGLDSRDCIINTLWMTSNNMKTIALLLLLLLPLYIRTMHHQWNYYVNYDYEHVFLLLINGKLSSNWLSGTTLIVTMKLLGNYDRNGVAAKPYSMACIKMPGQIIHPPTVVVSPALLSSRSCC